MPPTVFSAVILEYLCEPTAFGGFCEMLRSAFLPLVLSVVAQFVFAAYLRLGVLEVQGDLAEDCTYTSFPLRCIAMFAFVGYIVHENGIRWPWALSYSLPDYSSFEGLSAPAVWDALPMASKLQIVGVIGILEIWSETKFVLESDGETHIYI